jgi:hypothetical protein
MNEATRASIIREYGAVVEANDSAEEKAVATAKDMKAEAEKALAEVLGSTIVPRKGTVTWKGEAEVVEAVETSPLVG